METEPRYHQLTASDVIDAAAPVAAALGVSVKLAPEGNDPITIELSVGVDRVRVTPSVAACLLLGLVASSGVRLEITDTSAATRLPCDLRHIAWRNSHDPSALRRAFFHTMEAFSRSLRTSAV